MSLSKQDATDRKAESVLKAVVLILFGIYLLLFFKITIFKYSSLRDIFAGRVSGFRSLNLIPFKTVRDFMHIARQYGAYLWAFSNIMGNVLIVVPLGFCLPLLFGKMRNIRWSVLITMSTSLTIELCQYVFSMGSADIDDLIANTLGGICGYFVYLLLRKIIKKTWILYITTILAAVMVFIIGFTVAKVQFGSLLGLVHYTVEREGNENIPETPNDITGVLIDWKENQFSIYEDIMSVNSSLAAYAKKKEIAVDDSTQFYFFSFRSEGTVTIETYTPISALEARNTKPDSRVRIWMNESIADVVVFMEAVSSDYVEIMIPDEEIADKEEIEITPVPDVTEETDKEEIEVTPVPDVTEEADKEEIKVTPVPDITEEEEHQEELISGMIKSINEDGIEISLIESWEEENGDLISVATRIMLNVIFEADTVFTVRTIRNMGADYDIRSGSRSDLKEDLRVDLKGYRDGDNFVSYEVEIVIVIY